MQHKKWVLRGSAVRIGGLKNQLNHDAPCLQSIPTYVCVCMTLYVLDHAVLLKSLGIFMIYSTMRVLSMNLKLRRYQFNDAVLFHHPSEAQVFGSIAIANGVGRTARTWYKDRDGAG